MKRLITALFVAGLLGAPAAWAHGGHGHGHGHGHGKHGWKHDKHERKHWKHARKHGHFHNDVVVVQEPVYVQRPVVVQQYPVYQPYYGPGELNLSFRVPLN